MGLFDVFLNVVAKGINAVDDLQKTQSRISESSKFPLPNNPAVTIEEFSSMLENWQKIIINNHLPLFQMKAYTENQCLEEVQRIVENLNSAISNEIVSEIKRLNKYGAYEKVIFGGGDFLVKLAFWNNNIPNLKLFLDDSLEKVARKASPNYNV
jgi:hypothetical protein